MELEERPHVRLTALEEVGHAEREEAGHEYKDDDEHVGHRREEVARELALEDAPGVAKAVFTASKDLEQVTLSKGYLDQKLLSEAQVAELASLPSRDEMLGTLLATFNAPISAFARVINALKDEMETQGAENPAGLKVEAAAEATAE